MDFSDNRLRKTCTAQSYTLLAQRVLVNTVDAAAFESRVMYPVPAEVVPTRDYSLHVMGQYSSLTFRLPRIGNGVALLAVSREE